MNRKIINLGPYKYLCEHYINGIDFEDNVSKKFVVLRNYEIYNNIVYDKDFLFIEDSLYNDVKDNLITLTYPIHIDNVLSFSNTHKKFNQYNIEDIEELKYDILDENGNKANIKYDILRIYVPTIKNDIDFIIDIDNIINDIDFHYYCNLFSNLPNKCEKELIIDNTRFIEYIEFYIPNIQSLFKKENKYYILDDTSNIINVNNSKTIIDKNNNEVKIDINNISDYYRIKNLEIDNADTSGETPIIPSYIDELENSGKLYINNLINTFFIKKDSEENYNKVYINNLNNDTVNYNNNVINTSINITLYPYKEIIDNIYIMSGSLLPTESFMGTGNYFRLSSRMGFDNGTIALLNTFEFPGKIEEPDNYNNHQEALENNEIIEKQVTNYYNSFFIHENIESFEHDFENDIEEFEGIRSTGFIIQIATDLNFKDIVYESNINTDENNDNFIYDFSFSLNKIINHWYQLNEILILRSIFIDKRLNIVIYGNPVTLTKEWFKYLINDTENQILYFSKNGEDIKNNLIEQDFMDINQGFNFIENINCSIIEKTEEERNEEKEFLKNIKYNSQGSKTKIIYKPIFYKVNNLQSIELRNNIVQNIGINLSQYMTKVDTFNININGYNVKEFLRNDVYVIFKINANLVTEDSGYYNILDENFNYISSGSYSKY